MTFPARPRVKMVAERGGPWPDAPALSGHSSTNARACRATSPPSPRGSRPRGGSLLAIRTLCALCARNAHRGRPGPISRPSDPRIHCITQPARLPPQRAPRTVPGGVVAVSGGVIGPVSGSNTPAHRRPRVRIGPRPPPGSASPPGAARRWGASRLGAVARAAIPGSASGRGRRPPPTHPVRSSRRRPRARPSPSPPRRGCTRRGPRCRRCPRRCVPGSRGARGTGVGWSALQAARRRNHVRR